MKHGLNLIHVFLAWFKWTFKLHFLAVCMDVNMDTCMTSKTQTSASAKTYCYDVRYSQFDRYPGVMMTDTVWNRRACCEVLKNRTVSANFLVNSTLHTHAYAYTFKATKKAVGVWYNRYLNAPDQYLEKCDVFWRHSIGVCRQKTHFSAAYFGTFLW